MPENHSLFFDEWQSCLRAHYIHVLRVHDDVTEPTLRHVLRQTGLTDEDLLRLRQEALGEEANSLPLPPDEPLPVEEPAPPTVVEPPEDELEDDYRDNWDEPVEGLNQLSLF
jgi:hypothetical protein